MNYRSTIALLLVFIFMGCKSKEAYDYNQYLVKVESSLTRDIELTESKVGEYLDSAKFDSISLVSSRMGSLIQKKVDEVQQQSLPNVKEAGNFKAAYIKYFRYMQEIYQTYQEYGEQTNDQGRLRVSQKMNELTSRKNKVIADLQEVQHRYAKANGFKVEK